MLDTGFVQQLVVRLITLCSSLQSSEAATASQSLIPLLLLDPCSGKGREQRPSLGKPHCGLLICPQPEPSLKVTSQHQEVLSCTLSQLVNSSKWWVKLWNIKMRFFPPFLITFFFQCKSVRKVSFVASHCRSCFNKVLQFAGDIFNLSNKTRISVKTRKNIQEHMFTIYYVHLHRLF